MTRFPVPDVRDFDVPFSVAPRTRGEVEAVAGVLASGLLVGSGRHTRWCHDWLETQVGCRRALLTTSATTALELACLLLDLKPGDEVIVPSFTFASCANAIALRGAVPVFVDIRPDTLNLDEGLLEPAITPKTRAIMVVHYAGVACAMEPILAIAQRHGLAVIEDAAQGILARYRDRPLGSLGALGVYSFHGSKNITAGEGGALLVNDPALADRAEILWEKGTNRSRFLRGEVDKYTWEDVGSSFLPSEITAALLACQLAEAADITERRLRLWHRYQDGFADLAESGLAQLPHPPSDCRHNGHIFFLLVPSRQVRDAMIADLRAQRISAQFHYVPLHSAPAGLKLGRAAGALTMTEHAAARLLRLPLYDSLAPAQQDGVMRAVRASLARHARAGEDA